MKRSIKFNGGQNISAPEEELAESEVVLSLNLSVNQKPGYLVKRPDSEIVKYGDYSPKGFGENITYFKFYKRNGDKYDLTLYDWYPGDPPQVNGKRNILKWIKQPVSGGDPTQGYIWPFFSTFGQNIIGLPFGDRLLLTNGVDLMMFFEDEDSYGKLEITNVETAPSGVVTEWQETVDGEILIPTLLEFKVAYYFDEQPEKLSNTSSASELVDAQYMFNAGIEKIKLTNIPVSTNSRVSGRVIYCRFKNDSAGYADNNFSTWRKVAEIANNIDTEYEMVVAPPDEETALPENTDTVPIAKCMEEINNRVFYGNVIEPAEEAGVGFAYSQTFTITQSEGETLTNVIVPITLQWHNPGADNYIEYGDFEGNGGNDFKFMLNDIGVVTPLGFMMVEFRGEDWQGIGTPKEIDFKIRMPELKTATGEEIVIFYGKDGMASLSSWQDLYRKELLYSDMIALFHMDKYKESTKIYNCKSANHGTLHGAVVDFEDTDGGFFGGDKTQVYSTGKRLKLANTGDEGHIEFGNLGLGATEENGKLILWFKLGDPPFDNDVAYYPLIEYAQTTEIGVYLRYKVGDVPQIVLLPPDESFQIKTIDNPWDGEWHQVVLSWEKTGVSESKWYVHLDGVNQITYTDTANSGYSYGAGKAWSIGSYSDSSWIIDGNHLRTSLRPFWVDEFIWDKECVKTSDEIEKIYYRETYFGNAVGFVGGEPYGLVEKKCANRFYWSKENIPESISSDDWLEVGSATGIIQLKKLKNNLCILKKNELRLLYGTNMATDIAVEYWKLSDNLTGDVKNLGLIAPNSLDSIEGAIIGLAPLGIFIYDGSGFIYPGKDKVDPYLRGLSQAILQQALGEYYPKRSEYWLYVNERLFILDVPSGRWTEYTGIEPTCFELWEDDNGELVYADKNTSQIRKMLEDFDNDRKNKIAVECKGGKFCHMEGQERKHSELLAMWLRFTGGDKVDVNIDIDGKSKLYEHIEDGTKKPLKLGSRGELIQFEITENSTKVLEIKDLEFEYNVRRRP